MRFRYHEQALLRGLTGWVKNLPDGSVEVVLFGEEEQVLTMLEWLSVGPPRALIYELEVTELEPEINSETEPYSSFEIIQ